MLKRGIRGLWAAALIVALAGLGLHAATAPDRRADTPPETRMPVAVQSVVSDATTCATQCQVSHDRCRVQRKGSPSCDADRQLCLETCLRNKRR